MKSHTQKKTNAHVTNQYSTYWEAVWGSRDEDA
jgi:hypothetical protein